MPNLGPGELIIIFLIVIVLFGGGRIARLGGELGTAIREFRKGLNEGEKKNPEELPKPTSESK
jgi:sec-independent protein translocase protein TatA